jgi:hypothetical protein
VQAIASVVLSSVLLLWGANVQAGTLHVKVEHREAVAPVESGLEAGEIFDSKKLPEDFTDHTISDWYEIPNWLAGKWHKETQTDYYRYNYLTKVTDNTRYTRQASSDGIWGIQSDLSGHFWQFAAAPFSQYVDTETETIVQIVRLSESLECTGDRFVKRSVDTQLRVNKTTGKITSVETGEEISVFSPESDTMIKRETSSKVFDQTGKPVLLGLSLSFESKIGPFEAQNFYRGQNTRKLFLEYCKNTGILGAFGIHKYNASLVASSPLR